MKTWTTHVVQNGDDLALILPDEFVKIYGWKVGDEVDMTFDEGNDSLIVRRIKDSHS